MTNLTTPLFATKSQITVVMMAKSETAPTAQIADRRLSRDFSFGSGVSGGDEGASRSFVADHTFEPIPTAVIKNV